MRSETDFQKNILSEQFCLKFKLPRSSKVDLGLIENFVLSYYKEENRIRDPRYWYRADYHKLNYNQHTHWINDYICEAYNVKYYRKPVLTNRHGGISAIVQQTGELINTHNHIDVWDLNHSPDLSVLFTVSKMTEPVFVVFEYNDGRHKYNRLKIPLEQGYGIIFSSSLDHHITKNTNKDLLINLNMNYELL